MALTTNGTQQSNYAVAKVIFLNGKGANWYSGRGCPVIKNVVRYLTMMRNNPAYAHRHTICSFTLAQADEWFGIISGAILNPVNNKPYFKSI
tara:strand:+ start:639 stop:914 length:276 start_codon:yes stop_codon:yes gene_type:complete